MPLDYGDPGGPTIALALDRARATEPNRRLGSIVVNPGGPGGSGLELADVVQSILEQSGPSGEQVAARYDIVGFDPRGVNKSAPVRCAEDRGVTAFYGVDATPDDDAERAALIAAMRRFARGCARMSRARLAHVGTADAARDLDRIRAALGDEQLSYLGWSYGTELGTAYAEQFPDRVGRLVLDGAVDPDIDPVEFARTQAQALEHGFDVFAEQCAADPGCRLANDGDPAASYDRLLADLDRRPLRVGARELTASQVASGVAEALFTPDEWSELADALAAALQGKGRLLVRFWDHYAQRSSSGHYSNFSSAIAAIDCLDYTWPRDDAAYDALVTDIRAESPRFGQAFLWEFLPCGYWPVPPNPPGVATGPPAHPILVVGTTGDPSTPYAGAQALAAALPGAVLLTFEGDRHTAYLAGSACVDDAVSAFYLTGDPPPMGTVC